MDNAPTEYSDIVTDSSIAKLEVNEPKNSEDEGDNFNGFDNVTNNIKNDSQTCFKRNLRKRKYVEVTIKGLPESEIKRLAKKQNKKKKKKRLESDPEAEKIINGLLNGLTNDFVDISKVMVRQCKHCNKEEENKKLYVKLLRCKDCDENMGFKCLICEVVKHNLAGFYSHIDLRHSSIGKNLSAYTCMTIMHCEKCDTNFELQSSNFPVNCPVCSDKLLYECVTCDTRYETHADMMCHLQDNNCKLRCKPQYPGLYISLYKLFCRKCNRSFVIYYSRFKHSCHFCKVNLVYQCSYCNDLFDTYNNTIYHLKHCLRDGKPIICLRCKKKFSSFENLENHLKICEFDNKMYYRCLYCNFKSKFIDEYNKHKKSQVCRLCYKCKKLLKNVASLRTHLRRCTSETRKKSKFFCNKCNYNTKSNVVLQKHYRNKH